MIKPKTALSFFLVFLLFTLSCTTDKTSIEGLDFNLQVQPRQLCDHSFIKITYGFNLGETYQKMKKDYHVFVHFWRKQTRQMLIQDDHRPMIRTFKWDNETSFTYSRKLFIPKFIDDIFDIDFKGYETMVLSVGLYRPESKEDKITLFSQELKFRPASEVLPDIIYYEGWNTQETNPDAEDTRYRSWRWTTGEAQCILENTMKESTLIIHGGVDKEKLKDQQVTFVLNDTVLEEFVPQSGKFEKEYTLTPEMLGNHEELKLLIRTDKTFIPSSINPNTQDDRELGVQIFFLYFNEAL